MLRTPEIRLYSNSVVQQKCCPAKVLSSKSVDFILVNVAEADAATAPFILS
jgi:hypothetical protein